MPSTIRRGAPFVGAALLLLAAACGGGHHLGEYDFAGRSMALVVLSPTAPILLTPNYDVKESDDVISAVVKVGSKVARDVEGRRARARLDSAASRVSMADDLAKQTLERTSRYLGMRPVTSANGADFLLEIHLRNYGLDARGENAAYLFTNSEAVLLDRHTGREIWNVRVHGNDQLTPSMRGTGIPGGGIITAGTLRTVTVADFQEALNQLVALSSSRIADELRASLRDVR